MSARKDRLLTILKMQDVVIVSKAEQLVGSIRDKVNAGGDLEDAEPTLSEKATGD